MRLLAFLIVLALTLPPGALANCTPSTSTTGTSQVVVAANGSYIVSDICQPGCLFGIEIYSESNGISGLQRNDPGRDDTCGGAIRADTRSI